MIALLHYAVLKGVRDRSLPTFLLAPLVIVMTVLLGTSLTRGQLGYPLFIVRDLTPARNAAAAVAIANTLGAFFTGLTAFWMFRAELATKSIGAFILARGVRAIAAAQIVFAAAVGLIGWGGAILMVRALTSAFPDKFIVGALPFVAALIAAAAIGVCAAAISPAPAMLLVPCAASMGLAIAVLAGNRTAVLISALAVAFVCAIVSAVLMERRCAA